MKLVFDTETTGVIVKSLPAEHEAQPNLVQLAAILYNSTWESVSSLSLIIQPDGWEIPKEASDVHGITTEMARELGVPLIVALSTFNHLAKKADEHVGHNVPFDVSVMTTAFHRAGRLSSMTPLYPVDTCQMAAPILNIPPTEKMLKWGFTGPKNPNLTECIKFFFNEDLVGAHDALVDVVACARIYREILRRQNDGSGK